MNEQITVNKSFIKIFLFQHYEKCLKKVARFVVEQNEQVWTKRGLLITDPIERGLRVIEISILTEPAQQLPSSTN